MLLNIAIKSRYEYKDYIRLYLENGIVTSEHRYIMTQQLGRELTSTEIIHHKDGIKKNNDINNLEITTVFDHPTLHSKGETQIQLTCAKCGNEFFRNVRNVRTKLKNGQQDFYCNRSCAGSHFGYGRSKNIKI